MKNRYETMKHLRDRLSELFQLCGVQGEPVQIIPAPALIRLVEKLVGDHGLYSYLEGLDSQAERAVQAMKDRQLDDWNNRQNEERIARLEQELQAEQTRSEGVLKEQLSVIRDLIALRDKLLMRQSWLEEEAPKEENARKLAASQLRETARCLTNLGVEILETGGAFDSRYQTVVETRPVEAPDQIDQIAETFRPGYRFRGEILRPQEVILFAAT